MKQLFLYLVIAISTLQTAVAQENDRPKIYNPNADAEKDIDAAVARAKKEHKHVLLQIGGNWCIWCVRFHDLVKSDDTLTRLVNDNYVVVHVNHSPENKNEKILAKLEYPQRFGFPVFVVLNANGRRIHTQNSGYLEEGKGHSKKKVAEFLSQWSPASLQADSYKKQ